MSRLYIRLRTGFYTNRKTIRLRVAIGNDAFWVPPRLWAYCAENQPDGDLSGYQAQELAMLIGYEGDAKRMLVALKDCGLITSDGKINDWSEHNGYHKKFSDRAKSAAAARWQPARPKKEKKQKKEGTKERGKGITECSKHAPSIHFECFKHEVPIPEVLRSEVFYDIWAKWITHRKEIRHTLTPTSARISLDDLAKIGHDRAVAALKYSISKGWQGCYESKEDKAKSNGATVYPAQRKRAIEELLAVHPCNKQSLKHIDNPTKEQWEDYKKLKADLQTVTQEIATSMYTNQT